MPGDVRFSMIVSRGRHWDARKICFGNFIKEHPAMKTILAIGLGKSKSVFCKMDTIEFKPCTYEQADLS